MKNRIVLLAFLFLLPGLAFSQKKLKEKDVIGTWKLVIQINEDDEDEDEDYENREVDESFLGHVLSSGIKALVVNLMDEIDIRFEFYKDGTLEIYAMGDLDDDSDNKWYLTSAGELVIKGDNDRDRDDDDIWLLKDGKLQAYERRGSRLKEKDVYLEKVSN